MPGKGHRFTQKEDELAKKIAKFYREQKGFSKKRAKAVGYATVQKMRSKVERF